MDQEATQRLVEEIRATVSQAKVQPVSSTVSGVPAITAALGDEVRREAPVIGALVALAVLLRYLWVPAPGTRWQRLRPLLTSLLGSAVTLALFGWLDYPLSFGAVVLLPLLLGIGSSFPLYLAAVPNRRRVLVMSVASAAAFLALGLSPLPFVRDLGLALGIGILCTIGVAQLLSRFWPTPAMAETDDPGPRDPGGARPPTRRSIAVRVVAAVAAVVVAALGWVALPRLSVSANPVDMARGLPALADARTVESTLGASGEIAVRLSGPDVLSPEGLRWSTDASAVLRDRFRDQLPEVVGVSGLFSFLGPDPTPGQVRTALEAMPSYLSSAVVRPDRGVSLLIHGLKLQDLGTQERLLADVNAALPAVPRGYTADVVGLPVAAVRGYQVLLEDRYLANLAGIGVAGLVLVIGLRRRWDAARAVTAAVLATGWGLGLIWLLGLGLSPLTMALGSLVGVTGCEFVVLLSESRRRAQSWLWRSVAVACATSVLGYLALAASRLWLVREFGLVLGVAVGLSYLAAKLVVWSAPPRGSKAPHAMVPESRAAGAVEATA
jgi:predicted RND superfamily exporter protein